MVLAPAIETTAAGQVARKYQEEIFQQAQKGNVIAYLRTGLGKTLISVLLIKWICTQQDARDKRIFFIVPKVTLVEQQGSYIEKETGLKTCRLHGAMGLDFSDRGAWRKRIEGHSVFVITAQLFLEMVTHSTWSIEKCSLLIFDECHHARKNHPYNGIMREYKEIKDVKKRPKVFGMTASPYWNQKNPSLSIQTLEENLDAKVIGVHEHVSELEQHYSKFEEVIETYDYPPEAYPIFPSPTLFHCLKTFNANDPSLFDNLGISFNKLEMRYYMTLNNLGPYAASLFLFSEMHHQLDGQLQKAQKALSVESHMEAMSLDAEVASRLPPIGMFDILDVMDGYEPWFLDLSQDDASKLPVTVPLDWCTTKLQRLIEILKTHLQNPIQTIIFVEQRQTASCLAKVLEVVEELKDVVRCGYLVGVTKTMDGLSKLSGTPNVNPVELFRDRKINVLIATSVAEEGLDFPACELVIRFDALQHLVGYVQSRGRARSEVSKYVVMIQKDDVAQLERYRALQRGEFDLSMTYNHARATQPQAPPSRFAALEGSEDDEEEMDDDDEIVDLSERERYVVPSTGAVLTYDNAIGLISRLCGIIPHDTFTPPPKPLYSGEFQARLRLPAGLPLGPRDRLYIGYPKGSKKEAKRCVAYQAVKRLIKLNVFNEYLLPTSRDKGEEGEETEAVRGMAKVNKKKGLPPDVMEVDVKDPWCIAEKLWVHPMALDGKEVAGIVTGTSLPPVDMKIYGVEVRLLPAVPLEFDPEEEADQRRLMADFTAFGINSRITGKPYTGNLTFYLVPLNSNLAPDYLLMELIVRNQRGFRDWTSKFPKGESEDDGKNQIYVFNWHQLGRTYLLKKIRWDLTPQSIPPPGAREAGDGQTYYEYFVKKWTRKKRPAMVPETGPLLETTVVERVDLGSYDLQTGHAQMPLKEARTYILPRNCCRFLPFPGVLAKAFGVLPVLCRGITDLYRSREARFALRLPSIDDRLITEALTIPAAVVSFNNQRLETLGDAVLQLCTTVHLLNHYPHRHEGQLSELRKRHVSNNFLLRRALDLGLEQYVSSEIASVHKWRYVLEQGEGVSSSGGGYEDKARRYVKTAYPRRSLQDCMEALLGASYLHGGIDLALQTGTALGVVFGGLLPWHMRYRVGTPDVPVTALFENLEERLGYQFHSNDLLVEAVTHPSFVAETGGTSYQRLEFLGDAILDLVVLDYLYRKFPEATSHQLSFLRAKVIRAPALAYLAITKLNLHKTMLMNSTDLYKSIDAYVGPFNAISPQEIVDRGWKYDPPKAISDVFESVVGAVLVDSGYDYEKTAVVVKVIMWEVLEALEVDSVKDPVSELVEWVAKEGCLVKPVFNKPTQARGSLLAGGIPVEIHGLQVVGPITASSLSIAKFIAAERAHAVLADESSAFSLKKLCDCSAMVVDGDGKRAGDEQPAAEPNALNELVVRREGEEEKSLGMDQGDD
ncbi:type III restriction enzyme [Coprinopsis sp. MPI-PUGE-AT-0042]|nr:type III restriction enzyme [Coprinopsis sp. MPI-PUGE-AT-0042]